MKHHPSVTVIFAIVTASSLLFGLTSYLSKEREMKRRIYVEESLLRATREKLLMEERLMAQKRKAVALERQLMSMERAHRLTLVRLRGLERKFSSFKKELTRMESAKRSPASEVDLGQIIVSATPNLEGKVLLVNRPFQFVVVDLGSNQNLSVGSVLSIYRERDFIGRIQVEEVRDTVAACRILPEWTRHDIQENDFVKEL